MGTLAVHWGWLDTVPGFPDRLRENPPRQGFFEHPEYLAVRAHLPAPWQDILDLAYYSGWRKQEILGLTWDEIDMAGGVIRLSPARSKTLVGRILPISQPIAEALARRRARRDPDSPLVFHRDGIPVRRWRTAWRTACQAAGVPTRFLHDCRRTAARNLIRANVPERVAMLLTGHKSRAIFDRYNIINEQELLDAGDQLVAYLAQQAQAVPARRRPHRGRRRRPAHRITPPPRTTHHRIRAHGPLAPARVRGRQWPDTARLCAAAHARATGTNRPAIVAHAAPGRQAESRPSQRPRRRRPQRPASPAIAAPAASRRADHLPDPPVPTRPAWAAVKHGGRARRGWRKLHLGVDQSGVILVHTLTGATGDDATTALELLTAVEGPLVRVTADAASDTVAVYETARVRGATVVVPPARTATVSGHGPRSPARDRTITWVKTLGRRQWKKALGYHRQGRVENTFFRDTSIL